MVGPFSYPIAWKHQPLSFTDAAGSKGYDADFGSHWFYSSWPGSLRSLNISSLELFPITLFVNLWGDLMANQGSMLLTSNLASINLSWHSRSLILCCLRHNVFFKARHVPGLQNSCAEFISRFQKNSFVAITQDADRVSTPFRMSLLPENWWLIRGIFSVRH